MNRNFLNTKPKIDGVVENIYNPDPDIVPNPTTLGDGQVAVNTSNTKPRLFIKKVDGSLATFEDATATQQRINAGGSTLANHISDTNNPHTVTAFQVGLGNVNNTSDVNKPISTATQTALDTKVDKVTGKQLSTNDFTTAEKTKLSGIETGAQVNNIEVNLGSVHDDIAPLVVDNTLSVTSNNPIANKAVATKFVENNDKMVQLEQDVNVIGATGIALYKSSKELSQYIELPFDMYLKKIRDKIPFSIQLCFNVISKDTYWDNYAYYIIGCNYTYAGHAITYQDNNGIRHGYNGSYNYNDWMNKLSVPTTMIITFDGSSSLTYVNGKAGVSVNYLENTVTDSNKAFLGVGSTGNGGGVFNSTSDSKSNMYLMRFFDKTLSQLEVDQLTNQGRPIEANTTSLRANIEDEYIARNIKATQWVSSGYKKTNLIFNNMKFVYDDFITQYSSGSGAPITPPEAAFVEHTDVNTGDIWKACGKKHTEQFGVQHYKQINN